MADEFMKGLALFTTGATGWFVFAGWYRTPEYYALVQLINPAPEPQNVYDAIGIFASDFFLWLAILGALTFWVVVPALREYKRARGEGTD
jgi:hypothetical protein